MPKTKTKSKQKSPSLTIYASPVFRKLIGKLPGESDSSKVQAAVNRDQRVRELLAEETSVVVFIAKLSEVYQGLPICTKK